MARPRSGAHGGSGLHRFGLRSLLSRAYDRFRKLFDGLDRARLRDWVGLVLALLACLLVFALGLWAFVRIARSVLAGQTTAFDESVLRWLDQHATPRLDRMAIEVTALGSGLVVTVVVLALSA